MWKMIYVGQSICPHIQSSCKATFFKDLEFRACSSTPQMGKNEPKLGLYECRCDILKTSVYLFLELPDDVYYFLSKIISD